jgi:hypothetical protein
MAMNSISMQLWYRIIVPLFFYSENVALDLHGRSVKGKDFCTRGGLLHVD